jgi:glucose-1-phosphate thymidylyltransferase
MKGIILHGGHGSRLRPLTHTGPKQLLPIANKPMSQYCIDSLRNAGIIDIAIVIGGVGSNKVSEYYGDGSSFGVNTTFIEQDEPKGIAHAINLCKDFIKDEKFVVFLGDNIMTRPINDLVKKFEKSSAEAFLLLCNVDNPTQFGIAEINDKKIIKITEKPKNPKSNLAVTGIYFFTPNLFKILPNLKPSWRNELEIADALQLMIEEEKLINFEIITEFWKDTGTPDDIIKANRIILENLDQTFLEDKKHLCKISGKVSIGAETTFAKNSQIIGPVLIGNNCKIESNTIIGPNVTIGNNCIISNCKIENSIVMSDCIINSKIYIEKSIIAYNCKILAKTKSLIHDRFLLGEGTTLTL